MYKRFFGLGQFPFSIAPDPRYVFMSESHREALAHLLYGLTGGGGFVLLTGEIGAGKTTVCRMFLEQIPPHCNVAYIFNPRQTVLELLQSICDEFGLHVEHETVAPTIKKFIDSLNVYLLATHAGHQNNVLIIDEAQNLSADVLEQLRLLTNLETNERKLLQIILIGQPELRTMLARPELEQLAQRIIARFHLGALSADETAQYIAHRMAVAGTTGTLPFSSQSMRQIHRRTRGIPRRINLLCDRALLGAYARGKHHVDSRTVDLAAREVFDLQTAGPAARSPKWRYAAGLLAGVLAATGAMLAWDSREKIETMIARVRMGEPKRSIPPASATVEMIPAAAPAVAQIETAEPAEAVTTSPPDAPQTADTIDQAPPVLGDDVRDPAAAYAKLFELWNLAPAEGNPCTAAQKQGTYCFGGAKGLTEIRQLDRPGILTLQDDDRRNYYAILVGLGDEAATLELGNATQTVSLNALARRWQGAFVTLWRAPEGYRGPFRRGDRGAAVDWLAAQMAVLNKSDKPESGGRYDDALADQVRRFQIANGLLPDGVAGPQTMMRLAALAGLAEPRLKAVPMTASAPSRK